MGRLGIPGAEALETMKRVYGLEGLDCEGVFSHCPTAYLPDDPFTARQIDDFAGLVAAAAEAGMTFRHVHIAASDAINNYPRAAKAPFTMVRSGINLHGSFDPNGIRALKVEPVLTLKTRIAQVRQLPAGTTLGYGRTWRLESPRTIAVISAGYADGLPIALSNRGSVLIGASRCPIVGRISMDYATVDVTGVEGVAAGDEVICFGASGDERITPDDWAEIKGTHAYDIICSLGSRVERVVKASHGAEA
jgi:alanine racemase